MLQAPNFGINGNKKQQI